MVLVLASLLVMERSLKGSVKAIIDKGSPMAEGI